MSNERITTSALLQRLFKTRHIERFIKYYNKQMDNTPFSISLQRLCSDRGIQPAQVIQKSDIERTYGHQIFNGRRKPSRDKVIQLAFGFGMSYDETQEFLKKARKSALYPKIKRDAAIIYALKRGLDIDGIHAVLYDLELPLLGKEERYE